MPNEDVPAGRDLARLRPSLSQAGAVLGTSGRWVGELRARGLMPPAGATLPEYVAAWVAYQRTRTGVDHGEGADRV